MTFSDRNHKIGKSWVTLPQNPQKCIFGSFGGERGRARGRARARARRGGHALVSQKSSFEQDNPGGGLFF